MTWSVWSLSALPVCAWVNTVSPLRLSTSQDTTSENCALANGELAASARMRSDRIVVHAADLDAEFLAG